MSRQTALYERHVAAKGRMVEFAGWTLPVQYTAGPKAEHLRVRECAGLFDIDHMGQVEVSGSEALDFMQYIMTADVSTMPVWSARYSLMCYEDGTVVDDTFIYRLPDRYFVAINASNVKKDVQWMRLHQTGFSVKIDDVSDATYMMALQGPKALEILNPLTDTDLLSLPFHTMAETQVAGVPTRLGRTGYTGEDGCELFFAADQATTVWDAIMSAGEPEGLLPIGLAARDSLRFEACMPLYGQEISASITPLEAGMRWAVALPKEHFLGREALIKQRLEGTERRLVGFEMVDRGVPRHDYRVIGGSESPACGEPIGHVTSGMYAPTLDKFLGMALVPTGQHRRGTEIGIEIRGRIRKAVVVKKPFYIPAYRRQSK